MKLIAIMIVRNEEATLPRCLEYLSTQGLQVAVIDNGSTDRTPEILASFAPEFVTHVENVPFHGVFEWTALLGRAEQMQQRLVADWFHLNSPDEIMSSTRPGESLLELVCRADAAGFNIINYDEFAFVPMPGDPPAEGQAFDRLLSHYYFFAPRLMRQMRTWKNTPGFSNIGSGGHLLAGGEPLVYPENMTLKHYIALSHDHFTRKYGGRVYNQEELKRGWHGSRAHIDTERFNVPPACRLKKLPSFDARQLDTSDPWVKHFWEFEDWTPRVAG